jgi:hypothetical protein
MTDEPNTREETDEALEQLDTETLEDLDVDGDAEDVKGGTTWNCGPTKLR